MVNSEWASRSSISRALSVRDFSGLIGWKFVFALCAYGALWVPLDSLGCLGSLFLDADRV